MERIRKNTKLFLYICLAMFLLNSCTEEKEYLENNNRDLKFSRKTFKELLSFKDFNSAYQKVKNEKQRSIASRSALENEYNFTIVEDKEIKIIEVDSKTFYNILIQRDSVSAAYFENLLIMVEKINNVDQVSAYIMKYATSNGLMVFVPENDKEITPLFGRYIQHCSTVCVPMCIKPWREDVPCPAHPMSSSQCVASFQMCYDVCRDFYIPEGGGTDISSGDSGSSSGGGAGTPPTDSSPPPSGAQGASPPPELLIDPVFEEEEEEDVNKIPCEQLYKLCQKTNIKTAINQIGVTTEDDEEHGYSFVKNSSTYSANELFSGYDNTIQVPTGSNKIGGIHCHRDRDFGMFTWQDLLVLYYSYKNTNPLNRHEVTYMLSCSAGVYALKITDWMAFRAMINPVIGILDKKEREKVIEDKNDELGKTFDSNIPSSNLEVDLLLYLKNNNAGVSLFKANTDFSPSTTVTWNKISLNDTNPSLLTTTTEPCNP